MEEYKLLQKSVIKTYRKKIWSKFVKAIKNYNLINEGDKIAICMSGGKDSFLLALLMSELHRHGQFKFDIEYIIMNPGYTSEVLEKIKENLRLFNIEAKIFESSIFKVVDGSKSPCYLCARMRRGYLYDYAKELGCNKIALGHHLDDVVETILLGLIYNGTYSSMLPSLVSDHFEGMELIRPLYLIEEKDIIAWREYNKLEFIDCACSVTKNSDGKRLMMKGLLKELEKYNKDAKKSLFTSASNVNLNTVIAYKKDDFICNKYGK